MEEAARESLAEKERCALNADYGNLERLGRSSTRSSQVEMILSYGRSVQFFSPPAGDRFIQLPSANPAGLRIIQI